MGALVLNRENARILVPIVVIWVAVSARDEPLRRRLGHATVVGLVTAAVLLPVAVRNHAVSGEWLISTSQLGPNFYIGNHIGATGTYASLRPGRGNAARERADATDLAQEALGRALSPSEVSSYWLHRALDDISLEPGRWLGLMARKTLLVLNAGESSDTESIAEYARYSRILAVSRWWGFGVLLPLACAGLWITRHRWRALAVLYAIAASLAASVVVFYMFSRYRFPMIPVLVLFSAAALAALPRSRPERRAWIPPVLIAVGTGLVAHLPLTASSNDTHFNVGSALVRLGRPADGIPWLREALVLSPGDEETQFNLGVALTQAGRTAEAIDVFTMMTATHDDDARAHAALGALLRATGKPAEGLARLARAVRLQPQNASARVNYGVALWEDGRRDEAIAQYQEAVRLAPDDAIAHNNLALGLHQVGRIPEAIPHYDRALALKPDYAEAAANSGLALAASGDAGGAIARLEAALRAQPTNFGIHANLGDVLASIGRMDDAIAHYRLAVGHAPSSVTDMLSVLDRLARAYRKADRPAEAEAIERQARTLAEAAGRAAAKGQGGK
jgi:tetratricopeptide (TPR) repeat protein